MQPWHWQVFLAASGVIVILHMLAMIVILVQTLWRRRRRYAPWIRSERDWRGY